MEDERQHLAIAKHDAAWATPWRQMSTVGPALKRGPPEIPTRASCEVAQSTLKCDIAQTSEYLPCGDAQKSENTFRRTWSSSLLIL